MPVCSLLPTREATHCKGLPKREKCLLELHKTMCGAGKDSIAGRGISRGSKESVSFYLKHCFAFKGEIQGGETIGVSGNRCNVDIRTQKCSSCEQTCNETDMARAEIQIYTWKDCMKNDCLRLKLSCFEKLPREFMALLPSVSWKCHNLELKRTQVSVLSTKIQDSVN